MDHIQIKSELIEQLIGISKEAGEAILKVYNTNFDYQIKEDLSPLTKADTNSHNIICERLKILTPDIPILSEENSNIPFNIRSLWEQYWLVDPLDGTKEFIKRNGEFTVNIALIEDNRPILGIIHVPANHQTYWGSKHIGSYFTEYDSDPIEIKVSNYIDSPLRIACSRSHPSKRLNSCLDTIENYELITIGSSLKFCLVAQGKADLYPRFGPTSEWDTAAGDAVLSFAGGEVMQLDGCQLEYNKKDNLLNPNFIVGRDKKIIKEFLSSLT